MGVLLRVRGSFAIRGKGISTNWILSPKLAALKARVGEKDAPETVCGNIDGNPNTAVVKDESDRIKTVSRHAG